MSQFDEWCPVMYERNDPAPPPPSHRIPRAVAERAYVGYAARFGHCQTLERLCERGGFSAGELDMFAPGWREEASAVGVLRSELAEVVRKHEIARAALAKRGDDFADGVTAIAAERDAIKAHAEKLRAALVEACDSHETLYTEFMELERVRLDHTAVDHGNVLPAIDRWRALADTEPRAPGCRCDREIGDSACSVHPGEDVAS